MYKNGKVFPTWDLAHFTDLWFEYFEKKEEKERNQAAAKAVKTKPKPELFSWGWLMEKFERRSMGQRHYTSWTDPQPIPKPEGLDLEEVLAEHFRARLRRMFVRTECRPVLTVQMQPPYQDAEYPHSLPPGRDIRGKLAWRGTCPACQRDGLIFTREWFVCFGCLRDGTFADLEDLLTVKDFDEEECKQKVTWLRRN